MPRSARTSNSRRRTQTRAVLKRPANPRDARIATLYRDRKLTCPAIGKQLGLNASSVARVVRRLGLTRPNGWAARPIAANKARNDRIVKLYRSGMTTAQVAEELKSGLTSSGVIAVLKARGVARRQTGSWVPPRTAEFYKIRKFALGAAKRLGKGPDSSAAALARKARISVEAFRAHLRRLGIKARFGMGSARLNIDDVAAIRRLLVTTKRSHASIGKEFGVNNRTINAIAMGHTWKEVPWPAGKKYVRRQAVRKGTRRAGKRSGQVRRR